MSDEESEVSEEVAVAASGGSVPWIPLIIVLLVIPIITIIGVEFVVIPKLKKSLSLPPESASASAEHGAATVAPAKEADGHGGGHGAATAAGNSYEFKDIVTNLQGSMGTRFLKASFEVVSQEANLKGMILANESQIRDAIIGTMASRSIKELEAIGGRNALRASLVESINSALGLSLVEELYFNELIIQ